MKNEIQQSEAFLAAMNRSLYYLGLRARTEKQMRDYLHKKETQADVIEAVIERLHEYGYIDDERYAQRLIETQIQYGKKGKRAIAQKMWQSGIQEEVAQAALDEIDETAELDAARHWVEKLSEKWRDDPKRREKMYRRLAAKGFGYDITAQVLREYQQKMEEETVDFD